MNETIDFSRLIGRGAAVLLCLQAGLLAFHPLLADAQSEAKPAAEKVAPPVAGGDEGSAAKEAPAPSNEAAAKEKSAADKAADTSQEPTPTAKPAAELPPKPAGPANVAERKKAEERKKAIVEKKAALKRMKSAPRRLHLAKPGAPRRPIRAFLSTKPLPYQKASPQDRKGLEDMRRGKTSIDRAIVDRCAKEDVYRTTKRGNESDIPKLNDEILKRVATARAGNDAFVIVYKQALCKYLKDLLDNTPVVQINALLLIGYLYDEKINVEDGVKILVDALRDENLVEGAHYVACKGIVRAKQHAGPQAFKVADERAAATAMLKLAQKPEIQEILLEELVKALGSLRWPQSGPVPGRAEIGTFLANLALDVEQPIRIRVEAVISLCQLRIKDLVQNWNYELVGIVVGRVFEDLVSAYRDMEMTQEVFQWTTLRIANSMKDVFPYADAPFKEMAGKVGPMINRILDAKDVTDLEKVDPGPLSEWLAAHNPPKDLKLSPLAAPLRLPKVDEPTEKPEKPRAKEAEKAKGPAKTNAAPEKAGKASKGAK